MFERYTTEELKKFAGIVDEKSGRWTPYTQEGNFSTMCKSMRNMCSLLGIQFKDAVDLFFIHQDLVGEIYCREISNKYKNIGDGDLENMTENNKVGEIELELFRRKRKELGVTELPILIGQLTEKEEELLNNRDTKMIPFRQSIARYKKDIEREKNALIPDVGNIKKYEEEILFAEKQIKEVIDVEYNTLLGEYCASLKK
jgi:hypothetical protein